jgi:hypothetical protein
MERQRVATFSALLIVGGVVAAVMLWPRLTNRHPVFRLISEEEKAIVPPLLAGAWGQGREECVGKIEALHGATEERVFSELGEPNQTYEFSIEDPVPEFRIELLNTYPPGHARSRGVRILEWQWRYREFSFAVWFHKSDGRWVVLDTCRWKKGVVF